MMQAPPPQWYCPQALQLTAIPRYSLTRHPT
jgi:hypothetical protein